MVRGKLGCQEGRAYSVCKGRGSWNARYWYEYRRCQTFLTDNAVGKSNFLVYVLIERMLRKLPTVFCSNGEDQWLIKGGKVSLIGNEIRGQDHGDLIAKLGNLDSVDLDSVDLSVNVEELIWYLFDDHPPRKETQMHGWYGVIIHYSSPNPKANNLKWLDVTSEARRHYLDCWSWAEYYLLSFEPPQTHPRHFEIIC